MSLLLSILSILAAVVFLVTLSAGLLSIIKPLMSVREYLQHIAMGVRAIEHQTAPLVNRAHRTHELAAAAGERAQQADDTLRRILKAEHE